MRVLSIRKVFFLFFIYLLVCSPLISSAVEYQATTVDRCGDVTVMELTGEMDASLVEESYSKPIQAITSEFYTSHADNYDFVVVFSNFDFEMPDTDKTLGFYHGIKNDVQGIGIELYDNSTLYGSDSRLQGAIVMGYLDDKVTDSLDPEFSETMLILSHEILHRWACRVSFQDADGDISQSLLGKDNKHWSFLLDTGGSVMYGNKWHDNGDDTFTTLPGLKYYSPLDLYLMGLIGKSAVPPMLLIDNPEIDPARLTVTGETIDGTARTVTMDDIIAAEGERIPSVEDSRKRFRIGTILIGRPGTYEQSQVTRIRTIMNNWVMWFSALTDGKAQVVLDASTVADLPENPGGGDPVLDPREAPPEIMDGVSWLRENQNDDGSWQGAGVATARRDTTAVLRALENFSGVEPNYGDGLEWLEAGTSANSDNLAGTVEILARSGQAGPDLLDELRNELRSRQNSDGGWGADQKKYDSNPLDTACALSALATADVTGTAVVADAVDYLVSTQEQEGGWKCEAYEDDVRTTARALGALAAFRNDYALEEVLEKGLAWLYEKQNADGGFGNSAGTVEDTSLALMVMYPLGADQAAMNGALDYIWNFQGADGSWYDDPYQTALAVSALWLTGHEADLSVTTDSVSFTPASVTSLPCDLTIQAEIHNHGLNPVSETTVALYRDGIAASNKIAEHVISVDGNAAVPVEFNVEITAGVSHHFYIRVDSQNLIKESNENNNTALKLLHPETTYDFEIQDADVTVTPDAAEVLTTLTLTARIRNKGAATAYNVPLAWYADGGEILSTNVDTLPAGQEITREVTWQAARSGTYPLTAVIDPEDFYPEELSETNNSGSAVLTVSPVNQPNLAVKHTDLTVAPNPLLQGAAAEIAIPVVNNGFAPAENIQARAYDGVPAEGGTLIGTQTIDALAAGESRPVIFSWADVAEAGEHLVYVEVSAAGADEIRQDDNNAFVTVDALSLPDLAVSPGAIAVEPSVAREGDPVEIGVTVQNAGEQTVQDLTVGLFQDGRLLESRQITSLPGNSQAQARFFYDTTGSPGAHEITVKVDPDNLIAEQSETNNAASRGFGVQNADLWLTEPYISPNGDGVKDETRFFFTLDARQTVRVAVVNEDRQEVRTFGGELYEDVTGGDVVWDGLDDRGVLVADGQYQLQVRDESESILASLPVVVDNNRSLLMEAVGTDYFYHQNITCSLPDIADLQWFSDQSGFLVYISSMDEDAPQYPRGLYTMTPDGKVVTRLVPWEWQEAGESRPYEYIYSDYDLSPDDSQVAFSLSYGASQWEVWTAGTRDRQLRRLVTYDQNTSETRGVVGAVHFSPDNQSIAYRLQVDEDEEPCRLKMVSADGTDHREIAADTDMKSMVWRPDSTGVAYVVSDDYYDDYRIMLASPGSDQADTICSFSATVNKITWLTNDKLVVIADNPAEWSLYDVWLVNAAAPGNSPVLMGSYEGSYGTSWDEYKRIAYNFKNESVAVIDNSSSGWKVRQCDSQGNCRVVYETEPLPSEHDESDRLSDLRWSPGGDKLSFVDNRFESAGAGDFSYADKDWGFGDSWGTSPSFPGDDTENCDYNSHFVIIDSGTGVQQSYQLGTENACSGSSEPPMPMSFHVSAGGDSNWEEIGVLHYGPAPETRYLDLTGALTRDLNGQHILRISQAGTDEAYIRGIELVLDGEEGYPPTAAVAVDSQEPLLLPSSEHPLDACETIIDFYWDNLPSGFDKVELALTAREVNYLKHDLQWLGNGALIGWEDYYANLVGSDYWWLTSKRLFGINLENMDKAPIAGWRDMGDPETLTVSPRGNAIFYKQEVDPDSVCAGKGEQDTWLIRSLMNLTVGLTARKTSSAIELRGTAIDLYFDRYVLEYARVDAPEEWALVQPASEKIAVDEILAQWVPPGEGSYYIRLTANDRAGNRAVRRVRVFWGTGSSIANLYKTGVTYDGQTPEFTDDGELFSPKTDSSKEAVALHYLVREPLHLVFTVRDDQGNPVTSFEKNYSTVPSGGTEDYIIWDGLDDYGQVMPDGQYTISVFDYEFVVEIDRTPPEVSISLGDLRLQDKTKIFTELACKTEKNIEKVVLEYGKGESPNQWTEYKSLKWNDDVDDSAQMDYDEDEESNYKDVTYSFTGSEIEFAVGKTFRITAVDRAGNFSTRTTDHLLEEQMVLNLFFLGEDLSKVYQIPLRRVGGDFFPTKPLPEPFISPHEHCFKLLETIRLPLDFVSIQYQVGGEWREGNALHRPESGLVKMIWDNENIDLKTVTALRLKGVDTSGGIFYSNAVSLKMFLEIFRECPEGQQCQCRYNQLIQEHLARIQFQFAEIGADDPTRLKSHWQDYQVEENGIVLSGGLDFELPMPPAESLADNKAYALRIVATGTSGHRYKSNTYKRSDCLECLTEPPSFGNNVLYAGQVSIQDCNTQQDTNTLIPYYEAPESDINSYPPSGFTSINYYYQRNGQWNFLAGSTDNRQKSFEVLPRNLPEGDWQVRSELAYIGEGDQEQVLEDTFQLYVDRESPLARVTYPVDEARLCSQIIEINGKEKKFIDIEARCNDNYPLPFIEYHGIPDSFSPKIREEWNYQLYYARGENYSNWQPAMDVDGNPIKDTLPADGHIVKRWDIGDLPADKYSLKLLAVDHVGNVSCHTVSDVYLDGAVALQTYVDKRLFSPNGDGIADDVTLFYMLEEAADVNVAIGQTGTITETLIANQPHPPMDHSITWPAEGVADGIYTFTVSARDACGNTIDGKESVEVDTTPPAIDLIIPDPIGIITEIRGTAKDRNFQDYSLFARSADNPDHQILLAQQSDPVTDDVLGQWNTFGLSGEWQIVLKATDQVGNSNEISRAVTLGDRQELIMDMGVSPRIFSPNNDGAREQTVIRYDLNPDLGSEYEVTLAIAAAGVVCKIVELQQVPPGSQEYVWSGDNDADPPETVNDGEYTVTLTASPTASPGISQKETVTVVVDTAAPLIDLTSPLAEEYYKETLSIEGSITDDYLSSYQLECVLDGGTVFSKEGNQNREAYTFATLDQSAEGEYQLTVQAADEAENTARVMIPFVIDTTPPVVSLISPEEGAGYGGELTPLAISGTIDEKNPDSWQLRYGTGEEPQTWQELAGGTELPAGSPAQARLFDWPLGPADGVSDGAYTISLLVTDKAGWETEVLRQVAVDNTPPAIAVDFPTDGEYITTAVDLTGSVSDEHFSSYSVALSSGDCAGAEQWSVLREATEAVEQGVLAALTNLPADGDYCLRVAAADEMANSAEERINVIVDTRPPGAPTLSLSADPDDRRACLLTWEPPADEDLAGFAVYRNGEKIADTPAGKNTCPDSGLEEGVYAYTVRAVDHAGWESPPSNSVEHAVDFTPPSARLAVPRDGAVLNDLVEIKGTAYSADDFKQYRVYMGTAETVNQPEPDWTLLRISPEPVAYGVLALLDDPLNGAAEYVVKLEAEDIAGNISTCRSAFSIDDVPPDPPVLISVTATENDADITWDGSAADDLAGYLLYRNGELVNAEGPVIGSLKPYLLDPSLTGYADIDLVDGQHTYYLQAMDQAGNLSESSNSLAVTIDTRPPRALIEFPAGGHEFEKAIPVRAGCEDRDVDFIQIQYRAVTAENWIDLDAPLSLEPYVVTLDPLARGMEYGDYQLRAVATDMAGQTDPDPAVITVTYTDLTPPEPPAGLQGRATGNDIDFTWQVSEAEDLAGYNIYEIADSGPELLNPELLPEAAFIRENSPDGTTVYAVTASDTHDNESAFSESVSVRVYQPVLTQPESPTTAATVSISGGQAAADATVRLYRGDEVVAEVAADENGAFGADIDLRPGDNTFQAVAEDSAGNTSKSSDPVTVVYSPVPAVPTGLSVSVSGYDCTLSWTANAESNLAGYHVYRDDIRLTETPVEESRHLEAGLADGIYDYQVTAVNDHGFESDRSDPVSAKVGDTVAPPAPVNLTARVDSSDVTLTWQPGEGETPAGYNVERRDGQEWVRLNAALLTGLTLVDADRINGTYTYRVTAVDSAGNVSPPAETQAVVDVTGLHKPVFTSIRPAPEGGAIQLCWAPGEDDTPAGYYLYRGQASGGPYERINTTPLTDTCYLDIGLTNGTTYYYIVRAVDPVGNESPASDEAMATAGDDVPPESPVIHAPTTSGHPLTVTETTIGVTGEADPDAEVELYRNGRFVGSVMPQEGLVVEHDEIRYQVPYDGLNSIDSLVLSPDQRRIAYIGENPAGDSVLRVMDLAAAYVREVAAGNIRSCRWAPDSRQLAYVITGSSAAGGFSRIRLFNPITDADTVLAEADAEDSLRAPAWTADGTAVFFARQNGADDSFDILRKDPATGEVTPVQSGLAAAAGEVVTALSRSHDGAYLACATFVPASGTAGEIRVINVAGGGAVTIPGQPWYDAAQPAAMHKWCAWAPEADRLAVLVNDSGSPRLDVYDAAGGEQGTVAALPPEAARYDWYHDGGYLLHGADDGTGPVLRLSAVDGTEAPLDLDDLAGANISFQVFPGGYVWQDAAVSSESLELVRRCYSGGGGKAVFSFDDVNLEPGGNLLQALSVDLAGNFSPWSDSIYVTLDPEVLPDLAVTPDSFFVYPALPVSGETLIGTLTVNNRNPVAAENVVVEITVIDETGLREQVAVESLDYFEARSQADVSFLWETGGRLGQYRLQAVVDPGDYIYEADESNNQAEKSIRVVSEHGSQLAVAMADTALVRGDSTPATLEIFNSGPHIDGTLRLRVRESGSGEIVTVLDEQALFLEYGADKQYAYMIDSSGLRAGEYHLSAVLTDGSGTVAEDAVAFTVAPDIDLALTVGTDQLRYGANADVSMPARVRNNGFSPVDTADCRVAVVDSQGTEVYAGRQPLSGLQADTSLSPVFAWNTGFHAPGEYELIAEIITGETAVAAASGRLEIVPETVLGGRITVSPAWIVPGNSVTAEYRLTNTGNAPAADLPARLLLVDPAVGTVVDSVGMTLDVAANDTVQGSDLFETDLLALNTYQIRLQAGAPGEERTLDWASLTVADAAPPELSVVSPEIDGVYQAPFDLTVTARDRLSALDRVEYALDDGPWYPLPAADAAAGRYSRRFVPVEADEGGHVFRFRAADTHGNLSEPVPVAVTIAPRVDLSAALNLQEAGMNQDLVLSADLVNTAWAKEVVFASAVEDDQGGVIHAFEDTIVPLAADGTETLSRAWNTAATPAGDYRVRAAVRKNGTILAETLLPFVLRPVVDLAAAVSTDAPAYGMNADVRAEITVNSAGNYPVTPTITCTILDSDDRTVHAESRELPRLDHGDSAAEVLTWNTAARRAGQYRIRVETKVDGETVDTAEAAFAIQPTTAMEGTLSAPESVPMGDPLAAACTVTNTGNVLLAGLEIQVAVVDPDDGRKVLDGQTTADVDIAGRISDTMTLATAGLAAKTYQLVLSVAMAGEESVLAETTVAITDTTPPGLTVIRPQSGQIFGGPMELAVEAADDASGIDRVEYRIDDRAWQLLAADGADRYTALYTPVEAEAGPHTVTFRAVDRAGNESDRPVVDIRFEFYQAFQALTGDLSATPDPVLAGTAARFTYAVTNPDTRPVEDLTLRVELVEAAGGNTVLTLDRVIDLAAGQTAAGNFTETVSVPAEEYEAVLTARIEAPVDPRELAREPVEVLARPEIDSDKTVSGEVISLLVWINDNCRVDCDPCADPHRKTAPLNAENCQWVDCVRDDLVEAILDEAVLEYHIVTDKQDFAAELRNPRYTDILVLGDHQNLGFNGSAELMEKVHAGTGIVSSRWFQHTLNLKACPEITSLFGLRLDGPPWIHDYTVSLVDSPVSEEGGLAPAGTARRVAADEDTLIGGWLELLSKDKHSSWGGWPGLPACDPDSPAVVLGQYGQGRTVYFAFDLGLSLAGDSPDVAADLLANAVLYAHGIREDIYPWQIVPVVSRIETDDTGFDYRLTETRDPALRLYDPRSGTWVTDNPWQFDVQPEAKEPLRLTFFYLMPDQAGTYVTTTETGLMFADEYIGLDEQTLDLVVSADSHTRYDEVIGRIENLDMSWWRRGLRTGIVRHLERARDRNITSRHDIEKNIGDIISAIHSFFLLPDTADTGIRKELDTLLMIEQGRYYHYDQ